MRLSILSETQNLDRDVLRLQFCCLPNTPLLRTQLIDPDRSVHKK